MTRYMGTETEYGITCPDNPQISPLVTSTHAVVAYAALRTQARTSMSLPALVELYGLDGL